MISECKYKKLISKEILVGWQKVYVMSKRI